MNTTDSNGNNECTNIPKDRGFVFVQLLFSLVVAEIARQTSERFLQDYNLSLYLDASPAYLHLLVAVILVTTSWVGWSRCYAKNGFRLNKVFDLGYLRLLLDIMLVIIYFLLTKSVEVRNDNMEMMPSAKPESLFVMVTFGLYFLWDLLTKKPFKMSVQSLICFLVCIAIYFLICQKETNLTVIVVDLLLIFVLMLFRYLNEIEIATKNS